MCGMAVFRIFWYQLAWGGPAKKPFVTAVSPALTAASALHANTERICYEQATQPAGRLDPEVERYAHAKRAGTDAMAAWNPR